MREALVQAVAAVMFIVVGVNMLFSMQPVWWSIASLVLVFAGAGTFVIRAIAEFRKARATQSVARPLDGPVG
ncbi:MAG: hypothetical protein P0Y60_12000 [Candidatus Microbacterium colombiense]|nr:MAG: hypothetical protein P0Y60_12000 [Microbacterium sp.]